MNIVTWIVGQLFGSAAKATYKGFAMAEVATFLATNPNASLAAVTAAVNAQEELLIGRVVKFFPAWAVGPLEGLLEAETDNLVTTAYEEITAKVTAASTVV